jgi:hypothetical protein
MGEFTAAALGGATGLVLLWIWRRRQRPVEQKIRMTAKRQAELLDDERH